MSHSRNKNAERGWKVASLLAALLAARAVSSLADRGWKRAVGGDPPTNPHSADTAWGEAIVWSAISGALVGLARLVSQHGAAGAWRRLTGALPPGMEEGPSR